MQAYGQWWRLTGDGRRGLGYVGLSPAEARALGLGPASSSRAGQSASSPATPASTAPPAPVAIWIPVASTDDRFPLAQGQTYRVTASVSKNFSAAQVSDYLLAHGWSAVTLADQAAGDATPADWPAGETLGALEDNHRWLRGQGTHTGATTAIDVVSTLHALIAIPLSIYRIAAVWLLGPTVAGMPTAIIGPGPGLLGLDASIDAIDAATVYYAWQGDTDPQSVQDVADTMRGNGLPIAADVLDQRALELSGQVDKKRASARSAAGVASAVATLVLGVVGALRRH